ncbi:MAG: carboxypeptidase regulatory-like domain-containing protein, partial [Saprospiraceae bacterium]|nr:carboxypeptidase regulatory-like domain-containing protein [Saprospiraceae bacterium]
IHALHIDVTKGFLYTFGGGFSSARVHDLNADPYHPEYVGKFDDLGYIHDGYADNDTLYSCHIYSGQLAIVDMRNKQSPVLLGTVQTPGKFTHNAWLLDDHQHILTTDETTPSFLTSYDISDPTDIRELARYSPNDGTNSIGHNTHVLNDFAVTSWYTDGFTIVDAHKPDNLVCVGSYDTWPQAEGPSFDGCWGVYPFLPSQNILATNIPNTNGGTGKLFVFTPTYKRAAYLEGQVLDGCNNLPLTGATIKINGTGFTPEATTSSLGTYKTGIPESGVISVTISKPGYATQTKTYNFIPGELITWNLTLEPTAAYAITGKLVNKNTGTTLANTSFEMKGAAADYRLQTDANGQFNHDCVVGGSYRVGTWGYHVADAQVNSNGTITVALQPGYYDDYELDLGWAKTATATDGFWELGEPVGTSLSGQTMNPDMDIDTDNSDQCYVTGNGGGSAGNDDVDNGSVTLTSPVIKLNGYTDAVLSFYYWFQNGGGNGSPNDRFEVKVSNGTQTATVLTVNTPAESWKYSGEIHLKDYLTALTDNVRVQFIAYDDPPGHVSEAAVDVFQVVPGLVSAPAPDPNAQLALSPNPSSADFRLQYQWPKTQTVQLDVRNLLGQTVVSRVLNGDQGAVYFGENLPKGVYLVCLRAGERQSQVLKAVKQ